ncbi:GntR family transcriptional regulator [Haloferula helveola]|uniref:GntR family transcriptional regulator n=2 Tax=Haloferula helveola TaxID=490095 RepID=A0ABN6H5D3_9BACT|nr:GntR family transcriptional regulator [Haloferula helveola]
MLQVLTASDQVAQHLRDEIARGTWKDVMPGSDRLARELGVGRNTIDAALLILEQEGSLEKQGTGRRRRILQVHKLDAPGLAMHVLPYDRGDIGGSFLATLWNQLQLAGHRVDLADKTLEELRMDPKRVARMVERTGADNWIVGGGSLEVLRWFSEQDLNTFAVCGRYSTLRIAGASPDKTKAIARCVERLTELGHNRIMLLSREDRRKPHPGPMERAFLDALESNGIQPSDYHFPDWGNEQADFFRCLNSIFRYTPPTALILDGSYLYTATERHLAQKGILAPRDISLVSTDYNADAFYWSEPQISHISHQWTPVARRVVNWASRLARGQKDLRKTMTKARFIEGGTIGPKPGRVRPI